MTLLKLRRIKSRYLCPKIVLYLSLVILVYGYGGVVKGCQQISPDIAYFCCVAFKAIENVFYMLSL